MKKRTITRILSALLVCVLAFTDCGGRWIESGGAMAAQAAGDEETAGKTATGQKSYTDYLTKAEELGTPLAIYNYLK
ncbi:MAG: hypothetical protein NC399_06945, partial [Muribaculum sp.]|nr:hypothetical protein [Muribaculum sp.]